MGKRNEGAGYPEDGYHKRCLDELNLEYDALEYLLISLIDAHPRVKPSRAARLNSAYKAITGQTRPRPDEPDSILSQAIQRFLEMQDADYDRQLRADLGGPNNPISDDDGKTEHELAHAVADQLTAVDLYDLDAVTYERLFEHVYRRIRAKKKVKLITDDPDRYLHAIRGRVEFYDPEREERLFDDLSRVADILKRHGIELEIGKPFWRLERTGSEQI
ncbi:MAG: hypothetical protein AAFY73_14445 [Pseudomonadota bacterium]